jgi:hypothetical protein
MIRLHAGTKRPHVYPPTRERDSLLRLSLMLSGNYCTVDLVRVDLYGQLRTYQLW